MAVLRQWLRGEALNAAMDAAAGRMAQLYGRPDAMALAQAVGAELRERWPGLRVVGASTVGEILDGQPSTEGLILVLTAFASTRVAMAAFDCPPGREAQVARRLWRKLSQDHEVPRGMLLLGTPLSVELAPVLEALQPLLPVDCAVFGGCAGDYGEMLCGWVMADTLVFTRGVVALAFSGTELELALSHGLGWLPLSMELEATEAQGHDLLQIDHQPAERVYRRFIDAPLNEPLSRIAAEFPLLTERDGDLLARIPSGSGADQGLRFMADLRVGERFRIGCGDPRQMLEASRLLHEELLDFAPQAVLAFSCGCRRYFLQQQVALETVPLQALAPTAGFFGYGELAGGRGRPLRLLNGALLVVGFREGAAPPPATPRPLGDEAENTRDLQWRDSNLRDPYARAPHEPISAVLRLASSTALHLSQANTALSHLARTDRLTGLPNRAHLEAAFLQQHAAALRQGGRLSVVLLDIDDFKSVNDSHGHDAGDAVLRRFADLLRESLRHSDTVGRWGGEEFLMLLPGSGARAAQGVAEKLRQAVQAIDFPQVGTKTASLGVACLQFEESLESLLRRADEALYAAKRGGRNRVVLAK